MAEDNPQGLKPKSPLASMHTALSSSLPGVGLEFVLPIVTDLLAIMLKRCFPDQPASISAAKYYKMGFNRTARTAVASAYRQACLQMNHNPSSAESSKFADQYLKAAAEVPDEDVVAALDDDPKDLEVIKGTLI